MEIPLKGLSESGFPVVLLRRARSLRFLRQDTFGFQLGYKVLPSDVLPFTKRLTERYEAVLSVKNLHRKDGDGLEALFIQGRWLRKRSKGERDQAARTLRALAKCQDHFLRPPVVASANMRVFLGGEQSTIRRVVVRFEKLKVPHRVTKITA